MSFKHIAVITLMTAAAPATASAFGVGGGGCSNLPEYYRAVGVLQGMPSACDMSVEEARRIVYGRSAAVTTPVTPAPRAHYRRHRARTPRPY